MLTVDSFTPLQAWAENKVPMMPPGGDLSKDRKVEQKTDIKKKTQAEIEQEMAALQYTNPMLLEVGGSFFTVRHTHSGLVLMLCWCSSSTDFMQFQ